jgi:hypothetical protein
VRPPPHPPVPETVRERPAGDTGGVLVGLSSAEGPAGGDEPADVIASPYGIVNVVTAEAG